MIHRDTQLKIKALVTNWINWYFEETEKKTGLPYKYFKRWVFNHLEFDGLSGMYECIIHLQVDVENELPRTIMSVPFPVTIPEHDYSSTAKAITMKLLARAQEIYLSDVTRDEKG
jgi:hypothetical protein